MITDQRQTAVPSGSPLKTQGISQRTQLIKPNQVNNVGRTAASSRQSVRPSFNPVRPRTFNTDNSAAGPTPGAVSTTPTAGAVSAASATPAPAVINPSAPSAAQELTPVPPVDNTATEATNAYLSNARTAIQNMSDAEISALLDEIASGTLYGRDRNLTR